MKTLFIQTHELAQALDRNYWTCTDACTFFSSKLNYGEHKDFRSVATLVMRMLFLEQMKDRKWYDIRFRGLRDLAEPIYYYAVSDSERRQRLINSLLTRPDRTLCVLIPE